MTIKYDEVLKIVVKILKLISKPHYLGEKNTHKSSKHETSNF